MIKKKCEFQIYILINKKTQYLLNIIFDMLGNQDQGGITNYTTKQSDPKF